MEGIKESIERAFAGKDPERKYWALMLFETEMRLGVSSKPNKWVNVSNRFYSNGIEALEAYANTPCPASQLVDSLTKEGLEEEMKQMIVNYSDEKWLEENLYPYL